MEDIELLNEYTSLAMQLQEEYLKEKQDFKRQKTLNDKFVVLKNEIRKRMAGCLEGGSYAVDMQKIKRLYELLERAEKKHDTEAAAALRWAIFSLENYPKT